VKSDIPVDEGLDKENAVWKCHDPSKTVIDLKITTATATTTKSPRRRPSTRRNKSRGIVVNPRGQPSLDIKKAEKGWLFDQIFC
jgi:hypothetical protein